MEVLSDADIGTKARRGARGFGDDDAQFISVTGADLQTEWTLPSP